MEPFSDVVAQLNYRDASDSDGAEKRQRAF
jgi:hypothetical protein